MKISKPLLYAIGTVVLVIIAAGGYLLGSKHAVETMTIKQVTPTQAAAAMQGDHFYSDYRENTLLIRGIVVGVDQLSGSNIIRFKTDTSTNFKARCELSSNSIVPQTGTAVRVLTEGGIAERQPTAVLLKSCLVL